MWMMMIISLIDDKVYAALAAGMFVALMHILSRHHVIFNNYAV